MDDNDTKSLLDWRQEEEEEAGVRGQAEME